MAVTAGTGEAEPPAHLETTALRAPGRALSLRASFAWTIGGNTIYSLCQWGMLVALAKLGSVEMLGRFALALAVTAPVIMLSNLQLRNIQATDARREHPFGEYMGLRLATTGLALLVILAVALGSGQDTGAAQVILVIGIAKGIEAISDVIYGLLQQNERMDIMAISMGLKGVLSLGALTLGILLTRDLLSSSVGLALCWLLVLLAYDLPNAGLVLARKEGGAPRAAAASLFALVKPAWSLRSLAKLARLALPLGIVMMLISLNTNIPRYFIEHFLGTRELGFFAAIAYLLIAGNTIVNAMGTAASPRLSQFYFAGDTKKFTSLLLRLVGTGAALGIAGIALAWVLGSQILGFLYHDEYSGYSDVLAWMMLGASISFVASFLGFGMTAARSFRAQAPLFVVVTAVTIIGSALLVPAYHLVGAAIAITLAALVQLVGSLAVVIRALSEHRMKWAG